MTFNLSTMTKADLNAMLGDNALTASALKKIKHDDLCKMVLDASMQEVVAKKIEEAAAPVLDNSPALTPTLQEVLNNLTDLEKRVLVAHLDAGIDCNGADTLDAMRADNMTWSDVAETAKRTGLTKKQVNGVLASLSTKGLLVTDCDPVNGEGAVQQVLADFGIVAAFELMADGIEAKVVAPVKAEKAPKAAPAPKKARVLEDRVIVAPATDLKMVRPAGEGTKKHKIAEALLIGCTAERLMEITAWNRSTALSALRWDIGSQMGLGVERKGDKYFLILPAGVKAIPVRAKDVTKADALVAACK